MEISRLAIGLEHFPSRFCTSCFTNARVEKYVQQQKVRLFQEAPNIPTFCCIRDNIPNSFLVITLQIFVLLFWLLFCRVAVVV
jgi:hypothetical protein